jgi:hypothetical protein
MENLNNNISWRARKADDTDGEYNESNYKFPISSLGNIVCFDFTYGGHLRRWEFPEPVNLDFRRTAVAVYLKESSQDSAQRTFSLTCNLKEYKGYVGVLNNNKYSTNIFFFDDRKVSLYSNYYHKKIDGPCEVEFTFSANRSLKIETRPWKNT